MLQKKEAQLRDLQDEVNEIYAQCDKPEYDREEPLEVEEKKVKVAACQLAKP